MVLSLLIPTLMATVDRTNPPQAGGFLRSQFRTAGWGPAPLQDRI